MGIKVIAIGKGYYGDVMRGPGFGFLEFTINSPEEFSEAWMELDKSVSEEVRQDVEAELEERREALAAFRKSQGQKPKVSDFRKKKRDRKVEYDYPEDPEETAEKNRVADQKVAAKATAILDLNNKIEEESEMSDKISLVLESLDHQDDNHWTKDGKPLMSYIEDLVGSEDIKRSDVDSVKPGFVRITD